MQAISPCLNTIRQFHAAVFSECLGLIALRSFRESGDRDSSKKPVMEWVENDSDATGRIYTFAESANNRGMACYCIPGIVAERGMAGSANVVSMQTLLTDIDTGNTAEKLDSAVKYLGKPTLVVESGGITDMGHPKIHAYWKLAQPVTGDELRKLVQARHEIAVKIGGDEHFKSAHQPIRIAGSIYHKTQPSKLVTIREAL